jgi:flagellar assembly factor FliW
MDVKTSRFGKLMVAAGDLLTFPQGLIGLRNCHQWFLLADAQNPVLGWLQSVDDPEVALALVSPRRYVPEYQLRVARRDLQDLQLEHLRDAQVGVIVSRHEDALAVNLRAPVVINVEQRRGCQVISKDPLPVRRLLPLTPEVWRRSA